MTRNIILATVIWAAVISAGYVALVQIWHPVLNKAPTISLTNRLFVENYVYGKPAPTVLAGSSLTQRLPVDMLGPQFSNLALSGGNGLTGLAIVVKSPTPPKRVLVEINTIAAGIDGALLTSTFDEPAFTARRFVVALRKSYQPLSLFYGLVRGRAGGQEINAAPALNATQKRSIVEASARGMRIRLDEDSLRENVQALAALVAEAWKRGIAIALYEMPIEPELQNLPRPRQVRDAARAVFPPSSMCWLEIRLPGGAHTYDGEHLSPPDAIAAAQIIRANPPCENR